MRHVVFSALCALGVIGCTDTTRPTTPAPAPGHTATGSSSTPATAPTTVDKDNTGVNVRDRSDSVKTPINQNENKTDVDITAKIRQRVVDTKMSINAQNVKIITQDGHVTLRGPVKNVDEKNQIEKFAVDVAGADKVDNQLEVEANP